MKQLNFSTNFQNKWKRLLKKHYDPEKLKAVLVLLSDNQDLPPKYKDHALTGNLQGYRECHIEQDWLLIYQITDTSIDIVATGSHDDLFK